MQAPQVLSLPRIVIPWMVTALRFVLAPFVFLSLALGRTDTALLLLALSCMSDILDGHIARRLNVQTRVGMYFDATADFLMVLAGMMGLVSRGLYPAWCPVVVTVMFGQFIASSLGLRLGYDPLGKYYGGFLLGLVFAGILLPSIAASHGPAALGAFTAACIVSRGVSLLHSGGRDAEGERASIRQPARYIDRPSRQPGV